MLVAYMQIFHGLKLLISATTKVFQFFPIFSLLGKSKKLGLVFFQNDFYSQRWHNTSFFTCSRSLVRKLSGVFPSASTWCYKLGTRHSRTNNSKLGYLPQNGCAISGCRLSHKLDRVRFNIGFPVVGMDGRSVGRTVKLLPKILGWVDYYIFWGMGLRSARLELR